MRLEEYQINSFLFPYEFATKHFRDAQEDSASLGGRAVHLIVGSLEMIFPINMIIALFDKLIAHGVSYFFPEEPVIEESIVDFVKEDLQISNFSLELSCKDHVLAQRGLKTEEDLRSLGFFILSDVCDQNIEVPEFTVNLSSLKEKNNSNALSAPHQVRKTIADYVQQLLTEDDIEAFPELKEKLTSFSNRLNSYGRGDQSKEIDHLEELIKERNRLRQEKLPLMERLARLEEAMGQILTCQQVIPHNSLGIDTLETQEAWTPFLEQIQQIRIEGYPLGKFLTLIEDLKVADRERKIRWLKAYLLQYGGAEFWTKSVAFKTLHELAALWENPPNYALCFNLGG